MHIYFSGIGGTGISALAVIAKEAGYDVSGSDARNSQYLDWLRKKGITDIHVGLSREQIQAVHHKNPIDWFVYGSAQPLDFPDNPEFAFCDDNGIKMSKRDELINRIISDRNLKLVAVAGTHGKTTVTAMAVWLFKQMGVPVSYTVGAKVSFGDMGEYDPEAQYFIYEADEFDRNFLAFRPYLSIITGVDWDHPDIYPTRDDYYQAFGQFLSQSGQSLLWHEDADRLGVSNFENLFFLEENEPKIDQDMTLAGRVNRLDAWLVANAAARLLGKPVSELAETLNSFPGLSRRFEQISPNLYSDYAHTAPKIRGALQLAHEVAGNRVVVVYEGLHNTRQHFMKADLAQLFDDVKQLYIVPSYLAREDKNLKLLSPADLLSLLSSRAKAHAKAAELDGELLGQIKAHAANGDLVLCLSAGAGGGLDEWLREEFS